MITRLLAALAVVLAAAGVTAGVTAVADPDPPAARAQTLPVSLGTPDLACPGPETLLAPEGGRAERARGPVTIAALAADAAAVTASGAPAGTPTGAGLRVRALGRPAADEEGAEEEDEEDGEEAAAPTLAGGLELGLGAGSIVGGVLTATRAGPAVIEATGPGGAAPPLLGGLQATLARDGDLRGLAATACAAAVSDTWLVGGATSTGHRLRLLLTNPAATTAVADVAVHGPEGRVQTPAGEGVVVPAGSAVPVFVDALAPGLDRVAVHVTVRSGRVHATLHEAVLRGVTPGGTDDVPPSAEPARRQVVPGVAVVPGPRTGKLGDAGVTAIRVAVPGTEEAVTSVRLIGPEGEVGTDRPAVTNVEGGAVADVLVTGVPAGQYTAVVEADVPILAAAVVGRGTAPDGVGEFAWATGARPVRAGTLLALLPGTQRFLSLAAAERTGEIWVREVYAGGELGPHRELDVPAGTAPGIGLRSDAVGLLVEDVTAGPVHAALVQAVDDPAGQLLTVTPVAPGATSTAPRPVAVEDRAIAP